jgi:hypothetical protein
MNIEERINNLRNFLTEQANKAVSECDNIYAAIIGQETNVTTNKDTYSDVEENDFGFDYLEDDFYDPREDISDYETCDYLFA